MDEEYNRTDENGRGNTEQTCQFWRHIYGNEHGFLCLASANRDGDKLTGIRHTFHPYPTQAKAAATHALKESERGREVYHTAHLVKEGTERKKENSARVHSLWADLDGASVPEDPKPTAMVESSPGRWHVYWRLSKPIDQDRAEELNKRLTYAIGADKSKWALTTLLRPPQTTNYKRHEPFGVTLSSLDARREYDPEEIDRLLAPLASANGHGKTGHAEEEPPVRLGPSGLRVWRGEQAKYKETGELDRSSSLFKLGAILADAGASQLVIVEALKERDESLGWNKYTDRADGPMQYTNIAEKVASGEASSDASSDESPSYNMTDLGNAERLVAHHGDDLRYCHLWRKWFAWDGTRWAEDATGEVERRAVETVRGIYAETKAADDSDDRRRIARHAMASESRSRIEAMIALARSMPGIPVSPDDLDTDPWLLNCKNGTIDLRTGKLRNHLREDLITRLAPVEYKKDAKAPRFEKFLVEIFDGDEALISFVQRFAGYSLTGSTEERAFAILHGRGKNGKTTLVELLQDVSGDYATTTDTETILSKHYQGVGNDVAALKGSRFVATAEVEQGRALAESKVKSLTGSDTVTARFLYSEPFSFKPEFKLWLSTNNKPMIRGTDDAIWDRIRLIPFTQRFEGADADSRLPEKLRGEDAGVLAWMVRGCTQWQQNGLGVPEKVLAATEGYRTEMDVLAGFIDECCVVRPDTWCKFSNLYTAYTQWCEDSNEQPEKKRRFADNLTERGFERDVGAKNSKIRRGIALRHDGDPDPARVTDPTPKSGGSGPDSPSPTSETGNRVTDDGGSVTQENTCKSGVSEERVTESYRKSNNFDLSPRVGESLGKTVTIGNSVTQETEIDPPDDGSKLSVEEVVRELRRPHSGTKINHSIYIAGSTNLEILTRSVLTAMHRDPGAWKEAAAVVAEAANDPMNHPVECECEKCL